DACPGILLRAMEALKDAEELPGIPHVEAGPVVADAVDVRLPLAPAADLDARLADLGAELHRVGDEIAPDLAHQRRVAARARQGLQVHLGQPARFAAHRFEQRAYQRRHVDVGADDLAAPEAR